MTIEESVGCSGGGKVTVSLAEAVMMEVGGATASTTGAAEVAVEERMTSGPVTTGRDSEVMSQNRPPTTNAAARVSPSDTRTLRLVS